VEVRYSKDAVKVLRRCNKAVLIQQKIKEFATDPNVTSPNVTRLVGRPEYRLRVQDWRVVFRLEGDLMLIDDIGPRGTIY
jgi:mRNA interferase RelE/StbE